MNKIKFYYLFLLIFVVNCDKLFPEDNEGPRISIIKPSDFDKVNESVEILSLSPNYDIPKVNFAISRVEPNLISQDSLFYLFENKFDFTQDVNIYDEKIVGSDNDGKPLLFFWNTSTKSDSSCCLDYPDNSIWFLNVYGYDSNNNKTASDGIFVMVDNSISNPKLLNISSISLNEDGFFSIYWDRCEESDFLSYSLKKSFNQDISNMDTIYQSFNIDDTTYIDTLINPLIYQYYTLAVLDTFGYSIESDVHRSILDPLPLPVNIKSIHYDYDQTIIEWEQIIDTDLEEIKLLFSNFENSDKDTLLRSINFIDTTFILPDSIIFDPTIENWFWIMAVDTFSQVTLGSGSMNEINLPPLKSDITMVDFKEELGNFNIHWEINNEQDFLRYNLLESNSINMSNSNLIISIDDSSITTHTISNINYGEIRYYQIIVEDGWNQNTTSDVFAGNSNYYFNEKYDFYDTNDNLNFVINECNLGSNNCQYIIAGIATPNADTRSEVWVSIIDSLGVLDINNDQYFYNNPLESDEINSIIKVDDGYLLNITIGSNSSSIYDVKLIKLNSNLEFIYELVPCLLDSDFECGVNKNFSKGMMINLNNEYLLAGYTKYNNDLSSYFWIMKINDNEILNSFYNKAEAYDDFGLDGIVNTNDENENGIYDYGESFTDSNGDGIWNEHLYNTRGYDIIEDETNIVIVGTKYSNNNGDKNIFVTKFNNTLDTKIWEVELNLSGDDEALSIVMGLNNDYIVSGYRTNGFRGDKDIIVLKIDANTGIYNEISNGNWNGASDEVANKVIKTSDDSFVMIGYTSSFELGNKDVYTIKFDNTGTILWKRNYGCPFVDDIGNDIKETFEGGIGGYIIGASTSNTFNTDSWFLKTNHEGSINHNICE